VKKETLSLWQSSSYNITLIKMNNIKAIIEEINLQNGSNYKIDILKKHSENELFKRVLKMTYDNVIFTYGITMKNVSYNKNE
jgi:hypothetical protein